ncbi:MAG: ribonuclease P protein component [Flavobacteriaceae bacterium]
MFSKQKNEVKHLKSKKEIELLFSEGNHLASGVLKLVCEKQENLVLKLGFGVSKRHFPKAVDRNRIKRLIREAYKEIRLNPDYTVFYGRGFFVFTGKKMPRFNDMIPLMHDLINRWSSLKKT